MAAKLTDLGFVHRHKKERDIQKMEEKRQAEIWI
jgi:hypothetical protein